MFIPNTTGALSRKGASNLYAEDTMSAPVTVECAVVHLNKMVQKTSVRTDSSASRSNAEEFVSISKILFPKTVAIGQGDKFVISGFELRATKIEPRNSVIGELDHYEVDFTIWS